MVLGVLVDRKRGKQVKMLLERSGILLKDFRIKNLGQSLFIPVTARDDRVDENYANVSEADLARSCRSDCSLSARFRKFLEKEQRGTDLIDSLVPAAYELYHDLLILPTSYPNAPEELFQALGSIFNVSVIARKHAIRKNDVRSPQLDVLWHHRSLHDDISNGLFWTRTVQNGITYTWNPIYTMFCAGNITEKERVSRMAAQNQVVLDLYAGIGYFSLPYIVHAGASKVIAIDLNPHSVEALRRNVRLNRIDASKVQIYQGNNHDFLSDYRLQCDRVNLGLLPSSQSGWGLAIQALRDTGGYLHIHENVPSRGETEFCSFIKSTLDRLLQTYRPSARYLIEIAHTERVKSYSPRVHHLVFDVHILLANKPL